MVEFKDWLNSEILGEKVSGPANGQIMIPVGIMFLKRKKIESASNPMVMMVFSGCLMMISSQSSELLLLLKSMTKPHMFTNPLRINS